MVSTQARRWTALVAFGAFGMTAAFATGAAFGEALQRQARAVSIGHVAADPLPAPRSESVESRGTPGDSAEAPPVARALP